MLSWRWNFGAVQRRDEDGPGGDKSLCEISMQSLCKSCKLVSMLLDSYLSDPSVWEAEESRYDSQAVWTIQSFSLSVRFPISVQ